MLALPFVAKYGGAATAYVSDELILGVYAEQNSQGQRLATLHSGASVETLGVNGEFTQVRLSDGTSGWVKSAYLTNQIPATARLRQLEEELDRRRATTPALAEAAARSEVEQLRRELESKQAQLDAAHAGSSAAPPGVPRASPAESSATPAVVPRSATGTGRPWLAVAGMLAALGGGFWWGYCTLARRIKQKFGGIKVY